MPDGWFLTLYERSNPGELPPSRAPRILNLFEAQIFAAGGSIRFLEGLGHAAIVRVSDVPAGLLTEIAGDVKVDRIPVAVLGDPLSSLTVVQRTTLRARLLTFGFPEAEIQERFSSGDLADHTLRDYFEFILRRRRKVRYDATADVIVDDGAQQPTSEIEEL